MQDREDQEWPAAKDGSSPRPHGQPETPPGGAAGDTPRQPPVTPLLAVDPAAGSGAEGAKLEHLRVDVNATANAETGTASAAASSGGATCAREQVAANATPPMVGEGEQRTSSAASDRAAALALLERGEAAAVQSAQPSQQATCIWGIRWVRIEVRFVVEHPPQPCWC